MKRTRIIALCIAAFALLIIGRLYILQIVLHKVYLDKAERQYVSTARGVFDRGTIYFQNKDGSLVSAATLQSGFVVAVNPRILKNPENAYQKLNAILPTDHDVFLTKAAANSAYQEIAVHVDSDIGKKIGDLNISGLSVYKDRWRFYPGASTAADVIGLMGYQGNTYAGRYGLERQYESELERNDTGYVNFFAQIFSNLENSHDATLKEADIVTTIEPTVESALENVLASTSAKWDPDIIGGIIENPQTGEIYAMANLPTFDPNHPEKVKNIGDFSNGLVQNVYEMGSIVKPLTIAAGIDAGVITATSTYYDTGCMTLNKSELCNFDKKARGVTTMQDLLSQSLNVGAAHVEQLLGNARFDQYMYNFGLNQKTGIELPAEGANLVKNLKAPRDLEHAEAAFGQGIAFTPISTVRALSTLASGGVLVNPHVVKSVNYTIGVNKSTNFAQGPRVISQHTAEELDRMLTYSVDHVLAGGTLHLPNYSVAAKTGTAQIASPDGKYYSDRFLHSFIGYFPSYNPKFFVFLFMYNPKGAQFSSETLTAPFMETVRFLINYYEVPPDR